MCSSMQRAMVHIYERSNVKQSKIELRLMAELHEDIVAVKRKFRLTYGHVIRRKKAVGIKSV